MNRYVHQEAPEAKINGNEVNNNNSSTNNQSKEQQQPYKENG